MEKVSLVIKATSKQKKNQNLGQGCEYVYYLVLNLNQGAAKSTDSRYA